MAGLVGEALGYDEGINIFQSAECLVFSPMCSEEGLPDGTII